MNRRHRLVWIGLSLIPLTLWLVFFAWPVAAMLLRGLGDLGGVVEVLTRRRTAQVLQHTLTQALWGTAISVLLGVPGAYVLYRKKFPGRQFIRGIVVVPFVLPTVVVGAAFRALLRPSGPLGFLGWEESLPAIVAALVFFNYALVVRIVGNYWQRLDPRREEAAAALGASPMQVWWRITLPALRPAIYSASSLVFLFCATAFGVVVTLGGIGTNTVETEVWVQTSQFLDLQAAAVLSVLQLVIVGVSTLVFAGLRRRLPPAARLVRFPAAPLNVRKDGLALAITACVVVGLIAWPLVNLVRASLRTPQGWGLDNYRVLASEGEFNALAVPVTTALAFSLRTAVVAGLIALVIGTLVSVFTTRNFSIPGRKREGRARWLAPGGRIIGWYQGLLDGAYLLPVGVSAVTLGFGFLITLVRPGNTPYLLPIAQALVAIPLVVRVISPTLRSINPRQLEAGAVLGAGPWQVLARVEGPHLMRAAGVAAGFAFSVSLGEFGATTFLARPDQPTLPVVIARLLSRPGEMNYGMAMAAAVILAVLTATVMLVAERARGPHDDGL